MKKSVPMPFSLGVPNKSDVGIRSHDFFFSNISIFEFFFPIETAKRATMKI